MVACRHDALEPRHSDGALQRPQLASDHASWLASLPRGSSGGGLFLVALVGQPLDRQQSTYALNQSISVGVF